MSYLGSLYQKYMFNGICDFTSYELRTYKLRTAIMFLFTFLYILGTKIANTQVKCTSLFKTRKKKKMHSIRKLARNFPKDT